MGRIPVIRPIILTPLRESTVLSGEVVFSRVMNIEVVVRVCRDGRRKVICHCQKGGSTQLKHN